MRSDCTDLRFEITPACAYGMGNPPTEDVNMCRHCLRSGPGGTEHSNLPAAHAAAREKRAAFQPLNQIAERFGLPLSDDQYLYFFTLVAGLVLYWSARNLVHYLALRHYDIRDLQMRLARVGLRPEEARRVWAEFGSGRTGWSRPWALYTLVHWAGEEDQLTTAMSRHEYTRERKLPRSLDT